MKLYHGTSSENAKRILEEGLKGIEIIPGVPATAYVYMTEDLDLAETYGETVFLIESDDLDQEKLDSYEEGIGLVYNYQGIIAPEHLTLVL